MPAALADQLEQAAPAVLVVLVRLEVLGQLIDASRQDSNLDFRASGITIVEVILIDNRVFLCFRQRHGTRSFSSFVFVELAAILP
jgi:hypothetical protein